MPITLEEVLRTRFTPEERAEIEHGGREISRQNRTLQQLRKTMKLTQAQIAKAMSVSQASVAEMEARDDMMVSTVVRIVKALGGKVELVATLPRKGVFALQLGKGRSAPLGAKKAAAASRTQRGPKAKKAAAPRRTSAA